jgi:hypothetical protein
MGPVLDVVPNSGYADPGETMTKPNCTTGASVGETSSDASTFVQLLIGIAGGVGTLLKIGGASAGVAGGAAGALAVIGLCGFYLYERCAPRQGDPECTAGVVCNIELAFSSASTTVFPFSAQHTRVDVVVKSKYWSVVETGALAVKCNSDPLDSPILSNYYHTPQVCAAAAGALIGAIVGGAGGVAAAIAVGGAIAGACSAVPPIGWLCALIALIVAAIIAAVCALVGAFVGGNFAREAAGPVLPPTANGDGFFIEPGQYLRVNGNYLAFGDDKGAIVAWWVNGSAVAGTSVVGQPFSYTDPDDNFKQDGCPTSVPPRGGTTPDDDGTQASPH